MSDNDHPTTPDGAAGPDGPSTVLLDDEAALLLADEGTWQAARLLVAMRRPGPEGTANPDQAARHELAQWARDDVIDAHAVLLGVIHDIDFHQYSDGGDWLYSGQPVERIAADALDLAERVTEAAAEARARVVAATARRDWLTSGRLLRCAGCGEVIDPGLGDWRVCRGAAEHDWCHDDNPNMEDDQRGLTVDEAEDDAYSEDRIRSGGPYPGDVVEVTYPGTGHPIRAVWEADPDRPEAPGRARIDTSGLLWQADGLTGPVPGHESPDLLDLTAATGIRIIHTREDLQADAGPGEDPEPTDSADEEVVWVGRPGDYAPNADQARDDTGPTGYDCGWGL